MLAYYYQRCIDKLTETDNLGGARQATERCSERALRVSVSVKTDDHELGFSSFQMALREIHGNSIYHHSHFNHGFTAGWCSLKGQVNLELFSILKTKETLKVIRADYFTLSASLLLGHCYCEEGSMVESKDIKLTLSMTCTGTQGYT